MQHRLTYLVSLTIFSILCILPGIFGAKTNFVTYGTVLKLLNSDYGIRLHSHDVKYGSGSSQQSVTGIEIKEDVNSHWIVKAPTKKYVERGETVKCGDILRLEHLTTKKNLHSHQFLSPLTAEQEVSAYGNDGEGDSGDHWELICDNKEWIRDDPVRFRHVDTKAYLSTSGRMFGRPISGQMEIIGVTNPSQGTRWTTAEGVFIVPKEKETGNSHTEL